MKLSTNSLRAFLASMTAALGFTAASAYASVVVWTDVSANTSSPTVAGFISVPGYSTVNVVGTWNKIGANPYGYTYNFSSAVFANAPGWLRAAGSVNAPQFGGFGHAGSAISFVFDSVLPPEMRFAVTDVDGGGWSIKAYDSGDNPINLTTWDTEHYFGMTTNPGIKNSTLRPDAFTITFDGTNNAQGKIDVFAPDATTLGQIKRIDIYNSRTNPLNNTEWVGLVFGTTIPEPSSSLLMGVALGGFFLRRRR